MPTIQVIETIFAELGYNVVQNKGGVTQNFEITSKTEPARWGWVIDPETDSMVRKPFDLTIDGWKKVAKANVKRLNALRLPE
jgi:hypothetical protein